MKIYFSTFSIFSLVFCSCYYGKINDLPPRFRYLPTSQHEASTILDSLVNFLKNANLVDYDSIAVLSRLGNIDKYYDSCLGYNVKLYFNSEDSLNVDLWLNRKFNIITILSNNLDKISDSSLITDSSLINRIDSFCQKFSFLSETGKLLFPRIESRGYYYAVFYQTLSDSEIQALREKDLRRGKESLYNPCLTIYITNTFRFMETVHCI